MTGLYDYQNGYLNGYSEEIIGLVDTSNEEAGSFPVPVKNINGVVLGEANSKEEYINIWNEDAANASVGYLSGWYGPFHVLLIGKSRITVPPQPGTTQIFEQQFEAQFQ